MTVNFAHCLFEQSGTFKKEFERYARNFICDHILGIESGHSVPSLFDIINS